MIRKPANITKTFEKLRQELHSTRGRITLKSIKERYYVYRESSKWDKEKKRPRINSEYLGRILPDGTYVKKIATYSDDFEKAKAMIAERGGKIIWPEKGGGALLPQNSAEITTNEIDTKLLTALSMNARTSSANLGKLVGLSATATYSRIKNLEKEYQIRYLAELDLDKLGYMTYLILIKFSKEAPEEEKLKVTLEKDPRVQLALSTKGEYDLMIFYLTEMGENARFNINRARETIFPEYDARWYTAPVYPIYNFIPLRDDFFSVLRTRIRTRSKKATGPVEGNISASEYSVLCELNKNGAVDFSEIDDKYGYDKGKAQYAYHKLKKEEIIKRITLSLTALPIKYLALLYVEDVNDKDWESNKSDFLAHTIKETEGPINRYSLVADTGIPNGTFFVLPVFAEGDLQNAEKEIRSVMKNAKVTTSLVMFSVVGAPCFRRFDNTYTRQYFRLVNEYQTLKESPKIGYE